MRPTIPLLLLALVLAPLSITASSGGTSTATWTEGSAVTGQLVHGTGTFDQGGADCVPYNGSPWVKIIDPDSTTRSQWDGTLGQEGSHTSTFTVDKVGTWSLQVWNGCGVMDTDTLTVTSGTPPSVPSAPQNTQASAASSTSIQVQWSAPSSNGGSSIQYYGIYRNGAYDGSISWPTTSFSDNGLTAGQEYCYKISATNSEGEGPLSNEACVTLQDDGTASASFSASSAAQGNVITLTCDTTAPDPEPAGPFVNKCQIKRPDGSVAASQDTASYGHKVVTYTTDVAGTWTGLADNGWGVTDSDSISVSAVETSPSPPQSIAAQAQNGQVALSWSAPADWGTGGSREYRLFVDGSFDRVLAGTATSETVTGLTNGQEYSFKLRASTTHGTSTDSSTVVATPIAASDPPGAPTALTADCDTGTDCWDRADLSWFAPSDSGSGPVSSYTVYIAGTPVSGSAGLSVSVFDLEPETEYCFTVRANNAYGQGSDSNQACYTTEAEPVSLQPPSVPQNVTAEFGDAQVIVEWDEPADWGPGSSRIYEIFLTGIFELSTTDTNATVTGLNNDQNYGVEVRAKTSEGHGPFSPSILGHPEAATTSTSSSTTTTSTTANAAGTPDDTDWAALTIPIGLGSVAALGGAAVLWRAPKRAMGRKVLGGLVALAGLAIVVIAIASPDSWAWLVGGR